MNLPATQTPAALAPRSWGPVPNQRPAGSAPLRQRGWRPLLAALAPTVSTMLAVAAVATLAPRAGLAAERGETIYRQTCAKCHGASGEGVKDRDAKPLAGDRSIAELAAYIAKSMPEDKPGSCPPDDARLVSEYLFHAFYSPVAQARRQPARIELSRLTGRQYRNIVADLVQSFRYRGQWTDDRGLKADYFKTAQMRNDQRAFQRVDPVVDFPFGDGPPDEGISADEFSIRWQGGVFAPDSGEYEFILSADCGAQLWVNDPQRPLIDAMVKSGSEGEFRGSLELIGGRVYPIRLQIVKNKKAKERQASVSLRWRQPHAAPQVVPERRLSPNDFPAQFVLTTRFPPDDRSLGYERGASISEAWSQATADAALEIAHYVVERLPDLAHTKPSDSNYQVKVREFCRQWTERSFRRPLAAAEKEFFVDRPFASDAEPAAAVERCVLLTMLSPRFLYCEPPAEAGPAWQVADRLALALWDSLPDDQLSRAAASGKLAQPDEARRQAQRMATDLRARAKLREFFLHWLNVERFADLSKDSKAFPDFDLETITDLRESLDLLLEDVIWSDASDFRQLLLSEDVFLNGPLGRLYGAALPDDAPFGRVTLEANERAGVLTHPYMLAGLAYSATTSPIHRGVFIARSVLGRSLRPPPEAVAPTPPELQPELTTRERIALQTKAGACQSCHRMINPLGFALENFDAVGRFREREQGKPVDAGGEYQTRSGDTVHFENVRELAIFLATNDETHEAFVEQMFHNFVKQPIRAYDPAKRAKLYRKFAEQKFSVRKLMVEIALTAALDAPAPKTAVNLEPRTAVNLAPRTAVNPEPRTAVNAAPAAQSGRQPPDS